MIIIGNYSKVRLLIGKKGYKQLDDYVTKYLEKYNLDSSYNLLNDSDFKYENNTSYYIGWNDIKWYKGYYEIDAIMNGLDNLEKKQHSYSFFNVEEEISNSQKKDFIGKDNLDLKIATCKMVDDEKTIKKNNLQDVEETLDI